MALMLGAIADDFTGGSDLAGMLTAGGVRALQLFGTAHDARVLESAAEYDAVVVCLKTRSIPAPAACSRSLEALRLLRSLEARQVQFKYCSTFDSTERGNIGPVAEALMREMGVPFTIAVPALPINGRTQYMGHLFVGAQLLSESHMRRHPLNPMTDANLVRFLGKQTRVPIGLIDLHALRGGVEPFAGDGIALVDAVEDSDLHRIAARAADLPLITGGSGFGMALPAIWGASTNPVVRSEVPPDTGTLILAGSCSAATLDQLRALEQAGCPMHRLDPDRLDPGYAVDFVRQRLAPGQPVCVRSSAERVSHVPGEAIERALAQVAVGSRARRIVVAGGETSGAVVNALGVTAAEVTHVIDPGVPALRTLTDPPLALALKSGNFGARDFFLKAMRLWEAQS